MEKLPDSKKLRGLRDSTVRKSRASAKKAADIARSTIEEVQDGAEQTVGKTTDFVTQVSSKTAGLAGGTVSQTRLALDWLYNASFPEHPVPVFLMPTSSSPDDYVLLFDLDGLVESLRSGVPVRPKLEIWAARTDGYDLAHLANELRDDFVRQFEDTVGKTEDGLRPEIEELARHEREISHAIDQEKDLQLKSLLRWSAGFMLFAPIPLLMIALGSRPRLINISKLFDMLDDRGKVQSQKKQLEKELKQEMKTLESDFANTDRTLTRAVGRIQMRAHDQIQELEKSLCAIDGLAPVMDHPEPEQLGKPDIASYLAHPQFKERLPDRYHRVITALQESQVQGTEHRSAWRGPTRTVSKVREESA